MIHVRKCDIKFLLYDLHIRNGRATHWALIEDLSLHICARLTQICVIAREQHDTSVRLHADDTFNIFLGCDAGFSDLGSVFQLHISIAWQQHVINIVLGRSLLSCRCIRDLWSNMFIDFFDILSDCFRWRVWD